MFWKRKDAKEQGVTVLEKFASKQYLNAKKELARRLLEGDGMSKNEVKAVSLLEECVTLGDGDALLMLAKCCAIGCGITQNSERAKALLSESSKKNNEEALSLMGLINDWNGRKAVDLAGLLWVHQQADNEIVYF